MTQKQIESKTLFISSIMNFIITLAGIWVFVKTGIQALFLDCTFSFIGFISSILATTISKNSYKKTKHHPKGLHFLEPLYAILKAIVILALLVISITESSKTAYQYFVYGIGEKMNIAPILPYSIIMVSLCFGLGLYNSKKNKQLNNRSTILKAESKGNFIDGAQSLGLGIAFGLLNFIDINGSLGFLWYTGDFFITLVLVAISIKQPILILYDSFNELTGGINNDKSINNSIEPKLKEILNNSIENYGYEIIKVGMFIEVKVYINNELLIEDFYKIINIKEKLQNELSNIFENTYIQIIV